MKSGWHSSGWVPQRGRERWTQLASCALACLLTAVPVSEAGAAVQEISGACGVHAAWQEDMRKNSPYSKQRIEYWAEKLEQVRPLLKLSEEWDYYALGSILKRVALRPGTATETDKEIAAEVEALAAEVKAFSDASGSVEDLNDGELIPRSGDQESLPTGPAKRGPKRPEKKNTAVGKDPPPPRKKPSVERLRAKIRSAANPKKLTKVSTIRRRIPRPPVKPDPTKKPQPKPENVSVIIEAEGGRVKVAEIENAAGGLSAAERAQEIAKRIKKLADKDPHWYTRLEADTVEIKTGTEWVVRCSSAPEEFLVTADTIFARLEGTTPEKLAAELAMKINEAMGNQGVTVPDNRPAARSASENQAIAAVRLREEGDALYDKGEKEAALKKYLSALDFTNDLPPDKKYVAAYIRAASLYYEMKERAKAEELAQEALTLPCLTPEEKRDLQSFLP